MKLRSALWVIAALAVAGPVHAESNLRVALGISNAPPPPVVVYRESPPVVVVPRSGVYVVHDTRCSYDFFRYGVYWFIWNDGYWYRARSYRGPFTVIEARYVPTAIWNVPARHWRHHPHGGPPGLARNEYRHHHDRDYMAGEKHGRDHDDD
jgi:hypothetical protein